MYFNPKLWAPEEQENKMSKTGNKWPFWSNFPTAGGGAILPLHLLMSALNAMYHAKPWLRPRIDKMGVEIPEATFINQYLQLYNSLHVHDCINFLPPDPTDEVMLVQIWTLLDRIKTYGQTIQTIQDQRMSLSFKCTSTRQCVHPGRRKIRCWHFKRVPKTWPWKHLDPSLSHNNLYPGCRQTMCDIWTQGPHNRLFVYTGHVGWLPS